MTIKFLHSLAIVPDNPTFSPANSTGTTIAFDVRHDVADFGDPGGYVHYLTKMTNSNIEWGFNVYDQSSPETKKNRFYLFNYQGGLGTGASYSDPVIPGEWFRAVGRIDRTNRTVSIFKNGIKKYENIYQGSIEAAATCTISGGSVDSVTIINQGAGYPTGGTFVAVNFYRSLGDTTGSGAKGYVTKSDDKITGIVLTSGGSGYTLPPIVKIGIDPIDTNSQLNFGGCQYRGHYWKGALKNIKIWNIPLSDSEIMDDYNLINITSSLVSNWKADDCYGSILTDYVSALNGTLTGIEGQDYSWECASTTGNISGQKAGIGTGGKILIAGLAFGILYMISKRK